MADCKCVIRQIPLIEGEYVPIIAPISCSYFAILDCGPSAVMRSSDPDNPEAEYEIYAHNGYALIVPSHTMYRFTAGDILTYLKSLSGSGPAIVEFSL
jgi:hypothetical protein